MAITEAGGLELVVQTGPLRGRTYTLGVPTRRLLLGRHRACDIVFPTDAQHLMVGRFHAVIESRPQGLFLMNLHANGTFVNLTLVGEDGEIRLGETDTVQLGGEGPQISLRMIRAAMANAAPMPAPVAVPAAPAIGVPAVASASGNGTSPRVSELLKSFSKHLVELNDKMEESRGGSVLAEEVLNSLEVVVSQLADLRSALSFRSPN